MNILKTTIGYLAETLNVPVSSNVPGKRPQAFVTVNRDGGPVTRVDDRAALTVQVWHANRLQVEALADEAVHALITMPDNVDEVYRVDVQKAWFPEQGTQTFPRYVLTCEAYCSK